MAEKAKKTRKYALSSFTRSLNTLGTLMEESSPISIVSPIYEKMSKNWEKLEAAHEEFINVTDIDIEGQDGLQFLDAPKKKRQSILVKYSEYLKQAEEEGKEDKRREEEEGEVRRKRMFQEEVLKAEEITGVKLTAMKTEYYSEIESFRSSIETLRTLGSIPDEDRRNEGSKLEENFKVLRELKNGIVRLSPMVDHTYLAKSFEEIQKGFLDTKKLLLTGIKGEMDLSTSEGNSRINSMKKEEIRLPSFKGDEKCFPYLRYSVWRKQWDLLIVEYEERWWSGLLWDHLDEVARSHYVGWETDYKEAMERLKRFYGDPVKVISCVMKEIMSQQLINYGEYRNLVTYCSNLERNFNRLKSPGLEHEMSNTSTMTMIIRKFPRGVAEKWTEYLSALEDAVKAKPFEAFIGWLGSQREIWERMSTTVEVTQKRTDYNKSVVGFYGEERYESKDQRLCFRCGEAGHIR